MQLITLEENRTVAMSGKTNRITKKGLVPLYWSAEMPRLTPFSGGRESRTLQQPWKERGGY
jgi:hypothetical protein